MTEMYQEVTPATREEFICLARAFHYEGFDLATHVLGGDLNEDSIAYLKIRHGLPKEMTRAEVERHIVSSKFDKPVDLQRIMARQRALYLWNSGNLDREVAWVEIERVFPQYLDHYTMDEAWVSAIPLVEWPVVFAIFLKWHLSTCEVGPSKWRGSINWLSNEAWYRLRDTLQMICSDDSTAPKIGNFPNRWCWFAALWNWSGKDTRAKIEKCVKRHCLLEELYANVGPWSDETKRRKALEAFCAVVPTNFTVDEYHGGKPPNDRCHAWDHFVVGLSHEELTNWLAELKKPKQVTGDPKVLAIFNAYQIACKERRHVAAALMGAPGTQFVQVAPLLMNPQSTPGWQEAYKVLTNEKIGGSSIVDVYLACTPLKKEERRIIIAALLTPEEFTAKRKKFGFRFISAMFSSSITNNTRLFIHTYLEGLKTERK